MHQTNASFTEWHGVGVTNGMLGQLPSASTTVGAPPLFVIAYLVFINFVGSFIQGITTFGDAIIIQIMWHALASTTGDWMHSTPLGENDVQVGALLQYSRTCVLNPLVAALAYKAGATFVPMKLVAAASIPQLLATIFGEQLLIVVPHALLKFWFGVGCLTIAILFVAIKLFRAAEERIRFGKGATESRRGAEEPTVVDMQVVSVSPEDDSPSRSPSGTVLRRTLPPASAQPTLPMKIQIATAVTSAIAGLTSSLTGVGGPPFMILILACDLPPAFVRLLFPLATLPSLYVRYGMAIHDRLITVDMLPFHAAGVAAGVVGVLCGNRIGRCVGPKTFNVVVLVLLVLAAMMMLMDVPLLTLSLLAAGVFVMGFVWIRENKEIAAAAEAAESAKEGRVEGEEEEEVRSPVPLLQKFSAAAAELDPVASTRECVACDEAPRLYDNLEVMDEKPIS